MFNIPTWSKVSNPFYCKNKQSRRLLITVGDSWTYGDSLGGTKVRDGKDDTDYRLSHIYGALMASKLDCDWINLALPGVSNFCILNWLAKLLVVTTSYKQIDCIITLTESGRHEELHYISTNRTLQENLETTVYKTYSWILDLKRKYPHINFVTAHNFTDRLEVQSNMVCDRTWLEILCDSYIQNGTHVVVSEHIECMNYEHTFTDTPEIIDKAMARIEIMDECQYCNSGDSRHPNESGHALWADYLLTKI